MHETKEVINNLLMSDKLRQQIVDSHSFSFIVELIEPALKKHSIYY